MIKVETSDIEILKTLNAGDIVSISGTRATPLTKRFSPL